MRTYGLIGYPLGHSFSRKYFTDKFKAENKPEQYLNFEIEEIGKLPDIIASHPELAGLNVTIPYKEKVIPFLDRLDDVAAEIGAVNTIRISSLNGITLLEGFNTDVAGFSGSLKPLLKLWHKRALILGSGGASKAVKYSLERLGIEWLQVTRRPIPGDSIGYEELSDFLLESYTLIINTTPLGTFPKVEEFPDIPYRAITAKHLLFDLVYNPSVTRFLSLGKAQGAAIKNGYEMLEIQALESYRIWEPQAPAFGKEPAARQKSKG